MKKSNSITILLLIIILTSCFQKQIQVKKIIGEYYYENGFTSMRLIVKKNYTYDFEYKFKYIHNNNWENRKTSGNWNLRNNFIILNSHNQPNDSFVLLKVFEWVDSTMVKGEKKIYFHVDDSFLLLNNNWKLFNIDTSKYDVFYLGGELIFDSILFNLGLNHSCSVLSFFSNNNQSIFVKTLVTHFPKYKIKDNQNNSFTIIPLRNRYFLKRKILPYIKENDYFFNSPFEIIKDSTIRVSNFLLKRI